MQFKKRNRKVSLTRSRCWWHYWRHWWAIASWTIITTASMASSSTLMAVMFSRFMWPVWFACPRMSIWFRWLMRSGWLAWLVWLVWHVWLSWLVWPRIVWLLWPRIVWLLWPRIVWLLWPRVVWFAWFFNPLSQNDAAETLVWIGFFVLSPKDAQPRFGIAISGIFSTFIKDWFSCKKKLFLKCPKRFFSFFKLTNSFSFGVSNCFWLCKWIWIRLRIGNCLAKWTWSKYKNWIIQNPI